MAGTRALVQVPADGAGKKLDAYSYDLSDGRGTVYASTSVVADKDGANIAQVFPDGSQKVSVNSRGGTNYAAAGIINAAIATTSNLRLFRITNPAASGKTLYLNYLEMSQWAAAASVAIPIAAYRATDAPAGGTTITPLRVSDTSVAPVATAATLPTGGTAGDMIAAQLSPTALISTSVPLTPLIMHDSRVGRTGDMIIAQGTGILIQAVGTPDADMRFIFKASWEEAT